MHKEEEEAALSSRSPLKGPKKADGFDTFRKGSPPNFKMLGASR